MRFIYGFTLSAITIALGNVAYELTFTATTFGGILPFVFITASPLAFFALGRIYPPETRIYRNGDI